MYFGGKEMVHLTLPFLISVLCRPPVRRPGRRDPAPWLAHRRGHPRARAGDQQDELRGIQVER